MISSGEALKKDGAHHGKRFSCWSSRSELPCFETQALPGASVRNSAHGKGHEEGGSAYTKAGSSLRSPPGNSQAPTPKTRVCLLYCFVLSPIPLTLRGLSPTTSFGEGVNLELQLIIIPGHGRCVPNLQTPLKVL